MLASTGWLVMLHNDTSARMEEWWRYATAVGSSEDNDKISEDGNLALVDYSVTSPIVVVTGIFASKDVTGYNFTTMVNILQFCSNLYRNYLFGNPLYHGRYQQPTLR